MKDGLKSDELWVGSVTSNTLSGDDVRFGAAIAAAEIVDGSIGVAEASTDLYQAGSHSLSSGSRWVTFGTAFTNATYHVATTGIDGTVAARTRIDVGSKAVGSFIAVGSPTSTEAFDWGALSRK